MIKRTFSEICSDICDYFSLKNSYKKINNFFKRFLMEKLFIDIKKKKTHTVTVVKPIHSPHNLKYVPYKIILNVKVCARFYFICNYIINVTLHCAQEHSESKFLKGMTK